MAGVSPAIAASDGGEADRGPDPPVPTVVGDGAGWSRSAWQCSVP